MKIEIETTKGDFTSVKIDGVKLPRCVGVQVGEDEQGSVVNITCLEAFSGDDGPNIEPGPAVGDPARYLDGAS